jgi:hypothetical protein
MEHIVNTLILIFFISCSQIKTDNKINILSETDSIKETSNLIVDKTEKDTIEKIELNTSNKRINLDLILNQKHNDYLASVDDSVLSLCCYEILDIIKSIDFGKFNKTTEEYDLENQKKTVDVYYLEESFLKEYYNDHTEVMHKDLICGKIENNDLIINSRIQIGMNKTDLLQMIFQPTETFERINRLDIYENELGESFTSYIFENYTLKGILFDSDYDWIDKEMKK